ncbi:putative periplasmic protein cpxP [Bdellovibrio bacteriovorus W]|nr:putative periplasmic protein cpxP [Bdellovibrio bacteriovorus W]
MIHFKRLLILSLFISLVTPFAEARGGKGKMKHGDPTEMDYKFHPEKMRELGLTDEQTEKLKTLRQKNKEDHRKSKEEMMATKKQFRELMKSNASREEILNSFKAMNEKKRELEQKRFEGMLDAREILTPEQRAKLFSKEK